MSILRLYNVSTEAKRRILARLNDGRLTVPAAIRELEALSALGVHAKPAPTRPITINPPAGNGWGWREQR